MRIVRNRPVAQPFTAARRLAGLKPCATVVILLPFACGTSGTYVARAFQAREGGPERAALQTKTEAAASVLAQARTALGGEAKLSSVKTVLANGRTRQIRGQNLVPIEFEIAMELPDRYVRKDEIPAQESEPTTVGFTRGELIQYPVPAPPTGPARAGAPPAPGPEQLDAARRMRLANVKQEFARLTLGLFATSFSSVPLTFSYAGKAEAPQGKADVLDVKGPENFAARFFVNADTHLPIMISWQPPSPAGRGPASAGQAPGPPQRGRGGPPPSRGEPPSRGDAPPAPAPPAPPAESTLYFADYRDVGGLQLPFRLRRATGADTVEETTFDGFKINVKIDPKKFEVRQ